VPFVPVSAPAEASACPWFIHPRLKHVNSPQNNALTAHSAPVRRAARPSPSRSTSSALLRSLPRPSGLALGVALAVAGTAQAAPAAPVAFGTEAAETAAETAADARTLDTIEVHQDRELKNAYTVRRASTATKLGLSLRETPQSVTVVTRQRLD